MRSAIGIDVGGTNLRIGLVREDGTVMRAEKKPSSILCNGKESVWLLIDEIEQFLKESRTQDIGAIGIGFPAPVSADGKRVFPCPNLKNPHGGFEKGEVACVLQEHFHIPVRIAKDTDMLLQAEIALRCVGAHEIITAFYFGTGVGNSVYYRGAMLCGAHGSGCDAGHIPVYHGTKRCGCGQRGCIECYASGARLNDLWKEKFSDCSIGELFIEHGESPEIKDFIEACAVAVATEVIIFDPSLVIIGGGVADMNGLPFRMLVEKIYEKVKRPYPADYMRIERACAKEHAGVRGAAFFALG